MNHSRLQYQLSTPKRDFAANIIVERISIGSPFSQAKVPVDKRICIGFLHVELLNWCEGKNTFLQAVEYYELESGDTVSDTNLLEQIRFLRFLEKAGYIKLHYKQTITEADIYEDLLSMGVNEGDRVMVHSTLSSIGPVDGGPETICKALMRAVGKSGTVMMPSFNFFNVNKYNPDKNKVYDPASTPTSNGAIPKLFLANAAGN